MNSIRDKCGDYDMYLIIFFSKKTCRDCLSIIIQLKNLEKSFQIRVVGIVPESEIGDNDELINLAGVQLDFLSSSKFIKFLPLYAPTLYGVTNRGLILFAIPSFKLEDGLIIQFMLQFFEKAYPLISRS
jgi:hypothetical protein